MGSLEVMSVRQPPSILTTSRPRFPPGGPGRPDISARASQSPCLLLAESRAAPCPSPEALPADLAFAAAEVLLPQLYPAATAETLPAPPPAAGTAALGGLR